MTPRRLLTLALGASLGLGLAHAPRLAAAPVPTKLTDEQIKAAVLKLNELTDEDGMNARLRELNKDPDAVKRMVKLAATLQKDGGEKNAPLKYNAALVLGKLALNVKDYANAEYFYEWCYEQGVKLGSGSKIVSAYEGLVSAFSVQKKFASVEELSKKLMDVEGGEEVNNARVFAMEAIVTAQSRQGNFDDALRSVENLVQLDKNGWYFVRLKATVLREAGKFDDSLEAYSESIERLKKAKRPDPETREKYVRLTRYQMTAVYVDKKDIDSAAKILQELIKEEPEKATYYNDLGFIWADAGKNLVEAEKLVRKALELDTKEREKLLKDDKIDAEEAKKENAAYLDSLGWILHKNGKHAEALTYLEKAAKDQDDGDHLEIWDHVADCLAALGRKNEAVATWTKALKLEDVGNRDVERRKKVTEKLKKAKAELAKPAGDK